MVYNEYREVVAGTGQNYVMLFDTDEQRARFLEAIRAGSEAIMALGKLRNAAFRSCVAYKHFHKHFVCQIKHILQIIRQMFDSKRQ